MFVAYIYRNLVLTAKPFQSITTFSCKSSPVYFQFLNICCSTTQRTCWLQFQKEGRTFLQTLSLKCLYHSSELQRSDYGNRSANLDIKTHKHEFHSRQKYFHASVMWYFCNKVFPVKSQVPFCVDILWI